MRKLLVIVLSIAVFFSFATLTKAQQLGVIPYQTFTSGDVDTVNSSNGNLVLDIPIYSLKQRGTLKPLTFSVTGNSAVFQQYENCDTYDVCVEYVDYSQYVDGDPNPTSPGFQIRSNYESDTFTASDWSRESRPGYALQDGPLPPCTPEDEYTCAFSYVDELFYSVTDPTGASHRMLLDYNTFNGPTYSLKSIDGSGYTFVTAAVVYNPYDPTNNYG